MDRMELDRLVAEHGTEVETNGAQDELCKVMSYRQELEYLFHLMGVTK
jgi:hypothetical protein